CSAERALGAAENRCPGPADKSPLLGIDLSGKSGARGRGSVGARWDRIGLDWGSAPLVEGMRVVRGGDCHLVLRGGVARRRDRFFRARVPRLRAGLPVAGRRCARTLLRPNEGPTPSTRAVAA